jgi:hypothetical protein
MCVVPTVTFERLFAFVILGHGRRHLLWFEVTRHPTAEWLARQITEAFAWASAPTYLVRDNDGAYGHVFSRRVMAMGIRDRPLRPSCRACIIGTRGYDFRKGQPSLLCPSWVDCIIATRGYDFRKGQASNRFVMWGWVSICF